MAPKVEIVSSLNLKSFFLKFLFFRLSRFKRKIIFAMLSIELKDNTKYFRSSSIQVYFVFSCHHMTIIGDGHGNQSTI